MPKSGELPSAGTTESKKQDEVSSVPAKQAAPPSKNGRFKADLVRSRSSLKARDLVYPAPMRTVVVPVEALNQAFPVSQTPDTPLSVMAVSGATISMATVEQLVAQAAIEDASKLKDDPELGKFRVQRPAPLLQQPDSTPNPSQLACPEPDPELGCVNIDPLKPLPSPRQPFVYLLARTDYFRSSNVFSGIDPIDDGLLRPGVTLFAAPPLGPDTFLIASANGNLIRYSSQTQINYNELGFEVGIFQRLSPTMFAKFGWTNQQLFLASDDLQGFSRGQRFLNDHGIRLELSRRDQLDKGKRWMLNTYYQLRVGFADPADRSRVINSLIASLSYDIQPSILQIGLDYQFALATFTRQQREDQYQQVGLRLTYTVFRSTQVNVFAGYSYGRSSDRLVDFNGFVFGASLGVNIALF